MALFTRYFFRIKSLFFPKSERLNIARYFCRGSIIEVGALSEFGKFAKGTNVKYADIHSNDELGCLLSDIPIPDLYGKKPLVELAYKLVGPKYGFDTIED